MKKFLHLILAFAIFFLAGCTSINQTSDTQSIQPKYQNYKEIPGITQEEIDEIEDLLANKPSLVYAVSVTTEAFLQEDGSVGGFSSLFTNRMSELFGFEFTVRPYIWTDLVEGIVSKEIDFTGEFTATPERLEIYFMTDSPIIQRSIKMFGDNKTDLREISKERPVKLAFLDGSTMYSIITATLDFPFEPVPIDDEFLVPDMLLNGEIDAFVGEGVFEACFDSFDFIKAKEYYPLTYSPVSLTTGNPELKPIIDIMQKYLKSRGYDELIELYNQGYTDYLEHRLFINLTEEEKNYILSHGTAETAVSVAYDPVNYPTSFYNAKEKEFQGIAIDILDEISSLTGLAFKAGTTANTIWPDLLDGLQNATYAVTTELLWTAQRDGRFLWTETPYYNDHYAMISRADYPNIDVNRLSLVKVGLLEDTAYTDIFLEWFPNSENTVVYRDRIEACNALEKGEIDFLMGSQSFLLHLTNYLERPNFKINIVFDYSVGSFFGLNKDEEILCSIINKTQQYVDTQGISESWQRKVFDYQSKMLKEMVPYVVAFAVILLAALFVVFILFIKNRRINKNLDKTVSQRTNELEAQTATLERRLEQQRLMATLSQNFITDGDIDKQITESLRLIGEFMDISRVILTKFEENSLNCLYEWNNPSQKVESKVGRVLPLAEVELQIADALSQKSITYFNLDDVGREDVLRRYQLEDVKNFLMMPIFVGDKIWGALDFSQCIDYIPWTASDINLGEMVAGILSGVMSRQQMESELVQMSSIVENSPQFITIVRAGGAFVYYNPAAVEVCGYSREELDSGGLGLLLRSEDYQYLKEHIVPIIIEKKKHVYELRFVTKSGETRIMSVSAFNLESDANAIGSIASDITDLIMMQRELEYQTSELALQTSTLNTIFESIPDLVFCKDVNGLYTRCNPSLGKSLGMPVSEVVGKSDAEIFKNDGEMTKFFAEADKRVIATQKTEKVEEMVTYPDGIQRIMETIRTPLIQSNEVIGMMGISRDITERKAAEETLKLTLDNLDACVYISEIETNEILFANNRMAEEYNDANCVGKKCWEVMQKGQSERCKSCAVPGLLETGGKDYVWEQHSATTGKYYRNTDSIIKWHDGRLVHMQHSVDITNLIRLQKDLESASKAKGDFLSRMSHEIRTPLNAIIGMVNIAMGASNNEKTNDCLVKADNASKHLLGVINDILDMSKIEADKFELEHREFNFEKMLINVTNVTNFRTEEKHQNFIVNLNGNVPESIIGDYLRLSQVLTNLLTNAVKFTPDGGTIILNIDKIEDNDDEITLRVEVEDNGIGITEEQQKRLFTSFEQADGGIARKFGGTGLGLAISKRIVELMGGKIWIESELDKGSKFIFTMKAGKGKEDMRAKLSDKIKKEDMRILAVDDSQEIREYFTHIMSIFELPCDVAADGLEALEMVRNCGDAPYNIFFIDWQMPEINGIELTKKIKEIAPDNSVVFMISVAEWSTIEREALAVGVRSFISKPLFPSTLINAINECMEFNPQKSKTGSADSNDEKSVDFGKYTILIAEDVEINREIMSAVLEETGICIDYAEDGLTAVSMFNENSDKYSLIFMDIHMPEMDGYEATRRIRALEVPKAKDIPIIAMTANVFREDIENCLAAGMNDHLGKPVDSDALFKKLSKYLS